MKNLRILLGITMALGFLFHSCNNGKTYAELKKDEKESIQRFIERQNIKVITLEQFLAQDSTTNVKENEFVLFSDNGVYMQVINRGSGELLGDGRSVMLARYAEQRINLNGTSDTITCNTMSGSSAQYPDEFSLTVEGKKYSGSFTPYSTMAGYSKAVPTGWLIPFKYIKAGLTASGRADIRLIVPHGVGQALAASSVYACYYDIKFKRFQ
ncbi:MAG: DUF4827 domain-containing protein [Phocaeicola sp.]